MTRYPLAVLWILLLAALAPTISQTALAQEPGASDAGLSGRLQGGAFYLQTDSQLSTNGSNRRTDDLNGPADTHDTLSGLAAIYLKYQFESGTALYAGNPLEAGEGIAVSAGVSQPIGNSLLDLSIIWSPIEEVWENPYQTGSARDETEVDAYGVKLEWQEIGGSPWEISYRIDRFDVADDVIGDLEADLERDGWTHELGLSYTLSLTPGLSLEPRLSYTFADKAGRSNTYHGVEAGVLLQRARPPWILIGVISGAFHQYQETHPLFDETRQEGLLTTFAQVMRLNLFGLPRLFASAGAGYIRSDSNIDFFDSGTLIGLASVGFQF